MFKILKDELEVGNIEGVLDFMENYNLNPTMIYENIATMQFNPQKENLLSGITAAKTKLTTTYTKRHKATKIKAAAKAKRAEIDNAKFDL